MIGVPVDIDRAEDEILAQIDHVWEQTRHVAMGTPPDASADGTVASPPTCRPSDSRTTARTAVP